MNTTREHSAFQGFCCDRPCERQCRRNLQDFFVGRVTISDPFTVFRPNYTSKLNFQTHLNQVYKLASHKIYLLSKISNLLTEHAALAIYRSKILPYFDYGDILYHSALNHNADRLQKLQNRALRICLKQEHPF